MLEEQKGINVDWERLAVRLEVCMSKYAGSLDELDADSLQRLMRLLNVRVTCYRGRAPATGVLDPSLLTTEQTWA